MSSDFFSWAASDHAGPWPPDDVATESLAAEQLAKNPGIPDAPPAAMVETSLAVAPAEFDLAPVQVKIYLFQDAVNQLLEEAKTLVVHDAATKEKAVSLATMAKAKWDEIEKVRNEWLAPHRTFTKSVNNLAKLFQEPLKKTENLLRTKVTQQNNRDKIELARQQAQIQAQAAELQQAAEAEAAMSNMPAPTIVTPVLPDAPPIVRTAHGSASSTKTWSFDIEDADKIPREYLFVDEKKIRNAVKAGVREIPGVRIFEKESTRFRKG